MTASERDRRNKFWLTKRGPYWYRTWYDATARQNRRISLGVTDRAEAERILYPRKDQPLTLRAPAIWSEIVAAAEAMRVAGNGRKSKVYFIEGDRAIKIGITDDVAKRFADIQASHYETLRLLAIDPRRPRAFCFPPDREGMVHQGSGDHGSRLGDPAERLDLNLGKVR